MPTRRDSSSRRSWSRPLTHEDFAPKPQGGSGDEGSRRSRPSRPTIMRQVESRASRNLRGHALRAAARVTVLLGADLFAFLLFRQLLNAVRYAAQFETAIGPFVNEVLYRGYLGGWRFAVAVVVSMVAAGSYGRGDDRRDPGRILLGCAVATWLPLWNRAWADPSLAMWQYAITVSALATLLIAMRQIVDVVVTRVTYPQALGRAVLVGPAADCVEMLGRRPFQQASGFKVVGVVHIDPQQPEPLASGFADLDRLLHEESVDTVVLCGPTSPEVLTKVVKSAIAAECHVLTAARTLELSGVEPEIVWRRGLPFIELRTVALRGQQLVLKRLLDIAVSAVGLVVLAPVMAALAIAVRLDSRGPAVFGQYRLGRYGSLFKCYKFRSMHTDAEERLRRDPALYEQYVRNDFKLPAEIDTRVTRVGRFLRKTSLDELPQLWNVLTGSMSLVGPRPIVPQEICHYSSEEVLFLSLKPGLTGEWQVSGRSSLAYPDRAVMEIAYVMNWSLGRDLGILLRTIPAVLLQRGAH